MTESLSIRKEKFLKVANEKGFIILTEYKNNKTKVLAKCKKCGFENMVRPDNISSGKTCKACAMKKFTTSRKFSIDIFKDRVKEVSGDEYSVIGEYKNADTKIKMVHEKCGYIFFMTPNKFYHSGRRCPNCNNKSNPEKEIYDLLISKNIKFKEQYTMDDCRRILCMKFDFALDIDDTLILIEYNGIQHYKPVDIFGGEKNLRETQLRDKIKKDYCQRKNINLHYIDYTQNIKKELNNIIEYYANPEPS